MLQEIRDNLEQRLSNNVDSKCATDDEVRLCWLVSEIKRLYKKELKLLCLEEYGVDNWEGYSEAMHEYDILIREYENE